MIGAAVGQVQVLVGRGQSTDELTKRCVDRIFYISADAPPAIRMQAEAFRTNITQAIQRTVEEAQRSARTNMVAELSAAGLHDAARFLRGN